jgi:hypothetical protein
MKAVKRYTGIAIGATVILLVGFAIIAGASNAATYTGSATSYASCDGSTTMTASGRTVRRGWAANNFLPLGSWIEMVRPTRVQGIKFWKIMDRGGPGFALDFWSDSCSWMHSFGRQTVTFKSVPKSHLYRGKPHKGWKFRKSSRGARLVWSAAG